MQNELALMRVMFISLVKAVGEMWGDVFARVLYIQLADKLHVLGSTPGANSCFHSFLAFISERAI